MKALPLFLLNTLIIHLTFSQTNKNDSLRNIVENNLHPDTSRILAKAIWAFDLWDSNLDSLKLLADQALREAESINFKKGIALAKRALGNYYDEKGEKEKSIETYLEAIHLLESNNIKEQLPATYSNIGYVYDDQGRYEEALNFYMKSAQLYQDLENVYGLAQTYNNIGIVYQNQGNYGQSQEFFFKSLDEWNKINNEQAISYVYTNIGINYKYQEDYTNAIEYHSKALEIDRKFNDTYGISLNLDNIGSIYSDLGDFEKAFKYHEESVEIAKDLGSDRRSAFASISLAKICTQMNDAVKGIEYANKALIHAKNAGLLQVEMSGYTILGWCYRLLGDYTRAISYGERSIQLTREVPLADYRLALEQLFKSYEISGDYKQALTTHKKFKSIQDSILNDKNTKEITRLAAEYEFRKEKDSILFAQQKEMILVEEKSKRAQNQRIIIYLISVFLLISGIIIFIFRNKQLANKRMVVLRSRISQDLHDEVGSTLSSIAFYGEAAKKNPEKSPDLLEIISSNASKTIESMNDIVWAINSEKDSMKHLINRLRNYVHELESTGEIQIKFSNDQSVVDTHLNTIQRRNVYLTIKEAINNAIKHADADTINILIGLSAKIIQIKIQDNGKGFNPDATEKYPSGNGLINMRKRAEEIGGALDLTSQVNFGTTVALSFKP